MLRDLAESVYELREARRAKRKAKRDAAKKARKEATRTGAEEQRELEYLAMLAQQGEREAMASEDARSMAWEIQVRAEKILRESRQNELRERAYCAAREAEQLELIRQDGLCFRFQRTATMHRWRDSTELFESYEVGCTVRQFSVLSADDLNRIPAGVLAGEPLVLTGSSPIKRDVVLAACGDGAVRLVVYSLQRNKTSTGTSFVVGRAPDEIPVLGACLVRSGALQRKLGWLVLYACGDGFIRCGWDHWKQLFRANIGGPAPPKDPPPTNDDQEKESPWQASLPQLAPLEDDQPDHDDVIYGLAVHDEVLFSWSADGRIKKWCLDTGELLHTYCGTRGGVTTCIVSANGKFLLSAGDTSDPRIRLWDAQYMPPGHAGHANHTPVVECDAPESSPDYGEPTFYDHACDGCDRARRVMLAEHNIQKRADFQMALYRKAGKNDVAKLEHLLQDAREAVDEQASRNVADFARYHGGALRIFHEHRAHYVGVDGPGSHGEWINGLCLNASETLAASCGSDTFAKIWRFPEGDLVSRVKCNDWIMTCAMGTISDFQDLPIEVLVTGCADSTITIWDAHSGSPLQTLRGHSDAVADVCFLHQGRFASQKKTSAPSATVGTDPVSATIRDTGHEQDKEVSNNDKDDGEATRDETADACSTVKMAQNDEVEICNFVRSSSYDGTIRTWKLGSGLPFAPPPPVVESTRQTEATIQWEMPVQNGSPVLEFHIKQRENKIGDFEVVALVKVNTKENLTTFKRRMTALHPGSSYEFCVAASSEIGQGEWSLASEARRCQPAAPGRIDAPIVTQISTTSMTISWIAPDSMGAHIQEFAIRRRGGTSSRTFEESQEVLVSWQDARAGAEKERDAATARRRKLEAWLHENRHLGAKETLRTRRKLKDEDNLDNQRRVLVQVAMSATGSAATRKGITAEQLLEMSATLTGLEPGMAYQFSVIAVNKIGRGPWSLPSTSASASTCAPDAPGEAPWLQSTSTTSLTLAWMPPRTNGSALTAFVFRYGKAAVVDEMLQCETDEDTHASKARGFLESSEVQAATERVERATAAMHSKHVVEMKMTGVLTDADFEVLRVALYVMMHVSGDAGDEDDADADADADADKRSSKLLHPLPQRLEVNAAVRHPEQFLGRLRSFRLATRDAELGEKLRPAITPLRLPVINLVTDLGKSASALKLTLSRMLLTWLEAVVEYDDNVYKNTIFPVLAEATCAWRRRREILGSGLSTLRVGGKATHTTVEGLDAGEAYRFQFCAVNDQGTSGFSPASRSFVVKRGPPSMPLEVTASHPSIFRLTVAWAAPEQLFGSQVIAYHVVFRQAGRGAFVTAQTVPGSQRELQVSGLQPDTLYEFAVTAENEVGRGPRSEASIPTRTLPAQVPSAVAAPIILSADFRAVRLHWNAPSSDGGMPVLRFIVNAFRGAEATSMGTCAMLEQVSPADSYFVDIFPGVQTAAEGGDAFFMEDEVPYSFCVLAENHVGLSQPSEPSAAVVIVRPGTEF